MFVTSASPEDILRWFHNAAHDQEILCLLLANEEVRGTATGQFEGDHPNRLVSLIRSYSKTDASLGSRIAMLVFHEHANNLLEVPGTKGTRRIICAENMWAQPPSSSEVAIPLREISVFKNVTDDSYARRMVFANNSAEATIRLDAEFIDLLKIENPKKLPAICTFVRGIKDVAIKSLGENWTTKDVNDYFAKLRVFQSDLDAAPLPPPLGGIEQAYGHLMDLIKSVEANKEKLNKVLAGMAKKARLDGQESIVVARFINEENGTSEALQQLFLHLPSIDFSVATFRERRTKCFLIAEKIDVTLSLFRDYHIDRINENKTLRDERIEQRKERFLCFLHEQSGTHRQTALGSLPELPAGFWSALGRANALLGFSKIFDFIKQ